MKKRVEEPLPCTTMSMIEEDKKLIEEIKKGSEYSYNLLYKRWISVLYKFVYHYVKSESIADDIVQETFLSIWTHRLNLNPELSFKSYLFSISYHMLLKEIRRQINNPQMQEYADYQMGFITSADETERKMSFDFFLQALEKAKRKLPQRQREIFEMNKELNISIQDIAKELLISEQVVRNQLSASLKVIRSELSQYSCILLAFFLEV